VRHPETLAEVPADGYKGAYVADVASELHAEQGDVQRDLAEQCPTERADQFEGLRTDDAAGHHDLHARTHEQLVGDVEGVGETRARAIRENLSRVAEASLLERYV
jgi:hypothetical protein